MADQNLITRLDNRLDQLVNIDMSERGVEHLFEAARALQDGSLVGAAADALMAVPEGGTVLTHCNTGRLATAGDGTALAVLFAAINIAGGFLVTQRMLKMFRKD